MYIAVTQSATSPHARVPAVSAAVGADPERGAAADRGQGPPHRGQPAPRRPAAGGQVRRHWWTLSRYSALIGRQGAQHLVLAAGARRGAGQEQERDKPHDEDQVLKGLGYSTLRYYINAQEAAGARSQGDGEAPERDLHLHLQQGGQDGHRQGQGRRGDAPLLGV